MNVSARPKMTSDEFIRWAMEQPEGQHYELVAGEVVVMAPERSSHALAKLRITRLLADAVERAGLACTVYPDGMAVEVDPATIYEPDALVRCGEPLPDDTLRITDPLILIEVLSPSSRSRDTGAKLAGYFRIPSLRHYLILATDLRTVIHHCRDAAGAIQTRIVRDNRLRLDPPGIEIAGLFPDLPPQ